MIGIDPTDQGGVVAAFQDRRPSLLGQGSSLEDLAGIARARLADAAATAVVTVPAWANDEQRQRLADRAKTAGFAKVQLINRPTAVALAYSALHPAERTTVLVIELEESRIDVAVLAKSTNGFDVLSCDGSLDFDPASPAKLLEAVHSTALRALKHAGIGADKLSDILCAGRRDRIQAIRAQLAGALGREPRTDVAPEHAAALGAAVQASLLAQSPAQPATAASQSPSSQPRGRGCVLLLAVLLGTAVMLVIGT